MVSSLSIALGKIPFSAPVLPYKVNVFPPPEGPKSKIVPF